MFGHGGYPVEQEEPICPLAKNEVPLAPIPIIRDKYRPLLQYRVRNMVFNSLTGFASERCPRLYIGSRAIPAGIRYDVSQAGCKMMPQVKGCDFIPYVVGPDD